MLPVYGELLIHQAKVHDNDYAMLTTNLVIRISLSFHLESNFCGVHRKLKHYRYSKLKQEQGIE
jgi:hypothetical protein